MRRSLFGLCLVAVVAVVVSGAMAAPSPGGGLTAKPAKLHFGRVAVSQSESKTVTINNDSASGLTFDNSLQGTDFHYSLGTCGSIAAGQSCTMDIIYQPSGQGKDSGTYWLFFVRSGFTDGYTLQFAVSGTGIALK